MPGTSAKTAEVKLRVPIEMAATVERYAQAHTHGNKTKAYLHFLELGMASQSEAAPVTKADLLAVAAAQQASMQKLFAAMPAPQMPALPSAEAIGDAVGENVAEQLAERLPSLDAIDKLGEVTDEKSSRAFQRGFVAGKEAEDRRALAVALGMNPFKRTMCGAPFIKAFLPDSQIELLAGELPQAADLSHLPEAAAAEMPAYVHYSATVVNPGGVEKEPEVILTDVSDYAPQYDYTSVEETQVSEPIITPPPMESVPEPEVEASAEPAGPKHAAPSPVAERIAELRAAQAGASEEDEEEANEE